MDESFGRTFIVPLSPCCSARIVGPRPHSSWSPREEPLPHFAGTFNVSISRFRSIVVKKVENARAKSEKVRGDRIRLLHCNTRHTVCSKDNGPRRNLLPANLGKLRRDDRLYTNDTLKSHSSAMLHNFLIKFF